MSDAILAEFPPTCRDCGHELDCQLQDNGKGQLYTLVTCWEPTCLLQSVTRSLSTYYRLSESDLEGYRVMNRAKLSEVQA